MTEQLFTKQREPIGYLEATVQFPLYEGDSLNSSWNNFIYEEPGITDEGELGVCRRICKVINATVHQDR